MRGRRKGRTEEEEGAEKATGAEGSGPAARSARPEELIAVRERGNKKRRLALFATHLAPQDLASIAAQLLADAAMEARRQARRQPRQA